MADPNYPNQPGPASGQQDPYASMQSAPQPAAPQQAAPQPAAPQPAAPQQAAAQQAAPQQPTPQPGPQHFAQPQQPTPQPGPQQFAQPQQTAAQQPTPQPGPQQFAQPQQAAAQQAAPQQNMASPAANMKAPKPPKPAGKGLSTGALIGIIAGAVVLIGVICCLIFMGGKAKGGYNSPEEPVKAFFDGFNDRNNDAIRATFPEKLSDDENAVIESMIRDLNEADESVVFDLSDVDFSNGKKLSKSEAAKYGRGIKEAYEFNIDVPFTQDNLGSTVQAVEPCTFVTIQWKKKWFNIYVKLDQENIEVLDWGNAEEVDTEDATEATDGDGEEDATEATDGEGEYVDTLGDGLDDKEFVRGMTITLNGNQYTFPIAYQDVKDDLPIDLEGKDTNVLSPGDSESFSLDSTDYPNTYAYCTLENNTEENITVEESSLNSIDMGYYTYSDEGTPYPVELSEGITWGSTKEEVIAAYGTPTAVSEYGTVSYEFSDTETYGYAYLNLYFDEVDGGLYSFYYYNSAY